MEASGVRTQDNLVRGNEKRGYSREEGSAKGVSQEERGEERGGMESCRIAVNNCLRKYGI